MRNKFFEIVGIALKDTNYWKNNNILKFYDSKLLNEF